MSATTQIGRSNVTAEKLVDSAISSRAPRSVVLPGEGSTVIPSGSRAQAGSKHQRSLLVGDRDMTWPLAKVRESIRKAESTQTLARDRDELAGSVRPLRNVSCVENLENCWDTLRASDATAWAGRPSANAEKTEDWAISSRAARTAEGSTVRAKARRPQAGSKHQRSLRGRDRDMTWPLAKVRELIRKRDQRNSSGHVHRASERQHGVHGHRPVLHEESKLGSLAA
jgi:hypothetical protein